MIKYILCEYSIATFQPNPILNRSLTIHMKNEHRATDRMNAVTYDYTVTYLCVIYIYLDRYRISRDLNIFGEKLKLLTFNCDDGKISFT